MKERNEAGRLREEELKPSQEGMKVAAGMYEFEG